MRIAYICADPGIPVFGCKGCSIHVQEVIRALLKQGHQVELFATRLDGEPPQDLAIPVHQLPKIPKGDRTQRETAALSANLDLRLALENNGQFDLIYERYSLWSFTGMEYARTANIPGILEINAPLIEEHAQHRGLVHYEAAHEVAQRVFGAANALIAVSQGVADYLQRYPVAIGRIHVIPNGVNPDRFPIAIQPTIPTSQEVFTVGFVGTMKPWHGLPTLIEAFDALHRTDAHTRLLIVGDGPTKDEVFANLATRGLTDAVHFTGAVTAAEIPGLLASMDVAVAPYPPQTHFYFSPLKVYEYMAAGLPVVASDIGQIARLLCDRQNGLLCPPGDALQLAALLYQLRLQPEVRSRIGNAARQTVLENHTWDAVVQQILAAAKIIPTPKQNTTIPQLWR